MNNIDKEIKVFVKEEKDLTKRIKNLVIKCIQESFVVPKKLETGKDYHIWSTYPGCTLTFDGIDEILKVEKEVRSYYEENDCVSYNVYGKRGLLNHAITEVSLKKELLTKFKKYKLNSILIKEILDYLYSGKTVETYDHISWEKAKNNIYNK